MRPTTSTARRGSRAPGLLPPRARPLVPQGEELEFLCQLYVQAGTPEAVAGGAWQVGGPHYTHGQDWTFMVLSLKGLEITIVSLYCTCGAGVHGANQFKLSSLLAFLKGVRTPWLVFADWNMEPREAQMTPSLLNCMARLFYRLGWR